MFDELGNKLDRVLGKFRQRGVITEPMIRDGLREVRRVLLEADVNYKVTRQFLERMQERALGEQVIKSVSPGQQVVKIVQDALAALLGEGPATLEWASSVPTVILVVGLQGSGKTTTAAKLAKRLSGEGRAPLLVACDQYRPAAVDQLVTLGEQVGVPVHRGESGEDPVAVANAAVEAARRDNRAVLIVDTAGRLQIDEPMMDELRRLKADLAPQEILLVADAMTGQEAVKIAEGFDDVLGLSGVILTKMDGDARGGAAVSIRKVTGIPIKFVGTSETMDGLDVFDPKRIADRILGFGDAVSLVEKAQDVFDEKKADAFQKKIAKNTFDLDDFRIQLQQMKQMGSMNQVLSMMPGMSSKALKQLNMDDRQVGWTEAIINSMTLDERQKPESIDGSRRSRIAKGSGRPVQEINALLNQFYQMKKMIKKMGKIKHMKLPGMGNFGRF